MTKTLVCTIVQSLHPEYYKDEYKTKLQDIINQKLHGKEIVTPGENIQVNMIAMKQNLARVQARE